MANRLKMALVTTVCTLLDQGWSRRRIARELGIDRETVRRYARLRETPKPAGAPPGSDPPKTPISGTEASSNPAGAPPGSQASACEPFREIILTKLDLGLTATRVFQDLVTEHGFEAQYHSVRRFVARLRRSDPLPFRRIETAPGEQAQVDFGTGAPVITAEKRSARSTVTATSRWPRLTTRRRRSTWGAKSGLAGTAALCAFTTRASSRLPSTPGTTLAGSGPSRHTSPSRSAMASNRGRHDC